MNTLFSGGLKALTTNTNEYNFTFNQGIVTGANLAGVDFKTQRLTTDNRFRHLQPAVEFNLQGHAHPASAAGRGHLGEQALHLSGAERPAHCRLFVPPADSLHREPGGDIYWGLVQAYEDVQAKQRALEQSNQLLADNRKQLEIGTMAPLDVVNAESSVAADQQALISSQSALNYQQQIIKQAIARNLNDAALSAAPVIPTDRVSLEAIPEESQPVEALVQEAFQRRPELEQAVLTLRNDEITSEGRAQRAAADARCVRILRRERAGRLAEQDRSELLAQALPYPPGSFPTGGLRHGRANLFNSSAPDKGVGFSLTVPIRNRYAQSVQERSLMEYRQAELRLEQLHTQIRMQVVNAMFALTNDRAQVKAAGAAQDYAQQSLDAEQKKLHLGASTTANVLQQQRNLATAEDNLIGAAPPTPKTAPASTRRWPRPCSTTESICRKRRREMWQRRPWCRAWKPAKPGNEPTMTPPAAPAQQRCRLRNSSQQMTGTGPESRAIYLSCYSERMIGTTSAPPPDPANRKTQEN